MSSTKPTGISLELHRYRMACATGQIQDQSEALFRMVDLMGRERLRAATSRGSMQRSIAKNDMAVRRRMAGTS